MQFLQPKKDKCDTCEKFDNTPEECRTELINANQQKHIGDKDFVHNFKHIEITKASNDASYCAAAFDMQQVLLSPLGQVSSFYSRRLTNFNLRIIALMK